MGRILAVGGASAALVGVGLIVPVGVGWIETGRTSAYALGLILSGGILIAGGVGALLTSLRSEHGPSVPGGVRAALAATALFLAFFALEFSDGLVRQNGRLMYWNSFFFVPTLALLVGLVAARRWAWCAMRGVTAIAVLWFLVFAAIIPYGDVRTPEGPVPWYGRLYMICVSLAFASILAGAFCSLGRPEARRYFGLVRPEGKAAA